MNIRFRQDYNDVVYTRWTMCSACGTTDPEAFYASVKTRCKECLRAGVRRAKAKNPAKYKADKRKYKLRTKYGITAERYDEILAEQDGKCAICASPDPVRGDNFCVDHDHDCCPGEKTCGRCIRGLLCFPCNIHLGHVETWYLKNHDTIDEYLMSRV